MFEILHHLIWGCVQPCLYSGKKHEKPANNTKHLPSLLYQFAGASFFRLEPLKIGDLFSMVQEVISIGSYKSGWLPQRLGLAFVGLCQLCASFARVNDGNGHSPHSVPWLWLEEFFFDSEGFGWLFFLNGNKNHGGFSGGKYMVAVGLCVLVLGWRPWWFEELRLIKHFTSIDPSISLDLSQMPCI